MSRFSNIVKPILILGILTTALGAQAHEYWIQPLKYRLTSTENLEADLRVGIDFAGSKQAYLPNNFNTFAVTNANGTSPIEGRIGDMPAANFTPGVEGLQILNLFSGSQRLTWDTFQEFEDFVKMHGMDWVLARHAERGLPDEGFREAYTRFVKSLVAVGEGAGQDQFTGMFFELVAGQNPYTDDMSNGMPITVMFKGAPLADKQVDLFYRDTSGELTRLSVQSNAAGRAVVPYLGDGEYMVNVVHMVEPSAEDTERTKVVWHSLWGSLTYAIGA